MGSLKSLKTVNLNILQDQKAWVFYPTAIECFSFQRWQKPMKW